MINYIIVILCITGVVTLWVPEINPLITVLLWSVPTGAATGRAVAEIKENRCMNTKT